MRHDLELCFQLTFLVPTTFSPRFHSRQYCRCSRNIAFHSLQFGYLKRFQKKKTVFAFLILVMIEISPLLASLKLIVIKMSEVYDGTSVPRSCLFTLLLMAEGSWVFGNTDACRDQRVQAYGWFKIHLKSKIYSGYSGGEP